MKNIDLKQYLNLLIADDKENADKLLHEYIVSKARQIHEDLMREDDEIMDEAFDDIADDLEEIENEEFLGEEFEDVLEKVTFIIPDANHKATVTFESRADADVLLKYDATLENGIGDVEEGEDGHLILVDGEVEADIVVPAGALEDFYDLETEDFLDFEDYGDDVLDVVEPFVIVEEDVVNNDDVEHEDEVEDIADHNDDAENGSDEEIRSEEVENGFDDTEEDIINDVTNDFEENLEDLDLDAELEDLEDIVDDKKDN